MTFAYLIAFLIFSSFILFTATFLIIKPGLAIEIQRRFYAQINWKIEPISLPKELRNTKIMGWFLLILWVIATALLFKTR